MRETSSFWSPLYRRVIDNHTGHTIPCSVSCVYVDNPDIKEHPSKDLTNSSTCVCHPCRLNDLQTQLCHVENDTLLTDVTTSVSLSDKATSSSEKQSSRVYQYDDRSETNIGIAQLPSQARAFDISVQASHSPKPVPSSSPAMNDYDNCYQTDTPSHETQTCALPKEEYDNDYDDVATDSLSGFWRPLSTPTRCSRFRASSRLWTLYEEPEIIADDSSPKRSPMRSSLKLNLVKNNQNSVKCFPDTTIEGLSKCYRNYEFRENHSPSADIDSFCLTITRHPGLDFSDCPEQQSQKAEIPSISFNGNGERVDENTLGDDSVGSCNPKFPDTSVDRKDRHCMLSLNSSYLGVESRNIRFSECDLHLTPATFASPDVEIPSPALHDNGTRNGFLILDQIAESLAQFQTWDQNINSWCSPSSEMGDPDLLSFDRSPQLGWSDLRPTDWSSKPVAEDSISSPSVLRGNNSTTFAQEGTPLYCDVNQNSLYTCIGAAEVRTTYSYGDYDLIDQKEINGIYSGRENFQNQRKELYRSDTEKFENTINTNIKQSHSPGAMQFEGSSVDEAASNLKILYQLFTNEDTEKSQNHSCVSTEDENLTVFRFKRFLKKSLVKRHQGKKISRFLTSLKCISESSPDASPSCYRKRSKGTLGVLEDHPPDFTDQHNPVPILTSLKSLHQRHTQGYLSFEPTDGCSASSSSSCNQSLDSSPSTTDSAYCSISDSLVDSGCSDDSKVIPLERTPSAYSIGNSGSDALAKDGSWRSSDPTWNPPCGHLNNTGDFCQFNEADDRLMASPDQEKLLALADVLWQLDKCGTDIDSALLDNLRYGHFPARFSGD